MKIGRNALCHCDSGKKFKLCHGKDLTVEKFQPLQAKSVAAKPKLLVLMATRGSISLETHVALSSNMSGTDRVFLTVARKPIDEARNELARLAITVTDRLGIDYALWVDDDAYWQQGLVETALKAMHAHPHIDMLAGYFSGRSPFGACVAFRDSMDINSFPRPGVDCEPGDLVEVQRVGFHFVLTRTALLRRLPVNPFTPVSPQTDEDLKVGEDFAFCDNVRAIDGRIAVATGLLVAHVDPRDGVAYVPGVAPLRVVNNAYFSPGLAHLNPEGSQKVLELRSYGPTIDAQIAGEQESLKHFLGA